MDYNYFSSVVFDAYLTYPKKINDNSTTTKIISVGGDLNFGSVALNSTATKTMFIINSGNTALNISSINLPTGYSANWNSGSISAGGVQSVTVSFKPTTASTYNGTITINGDQTSGTNVIAVTGSGYNSSNNNLSNGLVAYYPFNGNANDESGNGKNGTVYGATLTTDKNGNANKAYSFNGTSSYIQIPSGVLSNSWNEFTISTWAFADNTIDNESHAIVYFGADGEVQLSSNLGTSGGSVNAARTWYSVSSSLTKGTWVNVTLTYKKGSQTILYLNGVNVNQTSVPSSDMFISGYLLNGIGCYLDTYGGKRFFWNGKIDEVRIYNRVLTTTEIQSLSQNKK